MSAIAPKKIHHLEVGKEYPAFFVSHMLHKLNKELPEGYAIYTFENGNEYIDKDIATTKKRKKNTLGPK